MIDSSTPLFIEAVAELGRNKGGHSQALLMKACDSAYSSINRRHSKRLWQPGTGWHQ